MVKYKLLTTCVTMALLAGCNSSDTDTSSSIQAYDGAIEGIAGTYTCEDGQTGDIPATDYTGYATIENLTVLTAPQTCSFTFEATDGAVDVSNGKDMSDLSLSIPTGFASAGTSPKATPFTTLVTKFLDGADYTVASATTVLTALGLDDILNSGVTVAEIMTDLDSVIADLKTSDSESYSKLMATTAILSDVLVKSQTTLTSLTVTQIATAAQNLATKIVTVYPNYPLDNSGNEIVVNIKSDSNYSSLASVISKVLSSTEIANLASPTTQESEPVEDDSDDSATGGTGATGTGTTGSTSGA